MKRLLDRVYARQRLISWERNARRAHNFRMGVIYFGILVALLLLSFLIGK